MKLPRRRFIQSGGALAASSLFFPSILKAQNMGGQKLRIACIGVGGRGKSHVEGYASEEIVAFCDVDEKQAAETYAKFPSIQRFTDYRVMFDRIGDQFDAVSIAVPDHMHYPIAMWAMAHGKHVLCEKPLVRTFDEAMQVKQAAKEAGVITQMGNQGHANDGLRQIQEWIAAGLIGEVKEVFHWTNRPIWPQGMSSLPAAAAIPSTIDWDLWLGVAPKADYSPDIAPFKWRGFWDYGCGAIGDIACHAMDASYTSLDLGYPTKVWSQSDDNTDICFPSESTIYYEFPAKGSRGPIKMTWMDGGRRPSDVPFVRNDFILADPSKNRKGQTNGSVLVGTKGSIFADMYAERPRLFPDEYFREVRMNNALPPETLPRVDATHFMEWVEGCKAGKQPGGSIAEYAADFTATALLGAVSLAAEGELEFDEKSKQFTNSAEANVLLKSRYEYRKEFLVS